MSRYRKKPVEVEAIQFNGNNSLDVCEWLGYLGVTKKQLESNFVFETPPGTITIQTLEGNMLANPGDYIIRGVQGEFYPCRSDIFEATYEKVEE